MFTQLFGHFLLNKNIINGEQLAVALEAKNSTRVKLGALAIDAGYMTAEQVEAVHEEQMHVDKRIGDIAIEMGFLTDAQVGELLSKQKTANIVLGQALIDAGYITNKQFEDALAEYKASAAFAGDEPDDEALAKDIVSIFDLEDDENKDFYVDYIMLLTKNAIRFIGDDFVLAGYQKDIEITCEHLSSQDLTGEGMTYYTAIGGGDEAFINIASRYAVDTNEDIDDITEAGLFEEVDEFVEACVGEFLNLQNGLFAVNMSNKKNIELDLTPQFAESNATITLAKGLSVCLQYTFGKVEFIIRKR